MKLQKAQKLKIGDIVIRKSSGESIVINYIVQVIRIKYFTDKRGRYEVEYPLIKIRGYSLENLTIPEDGHITTLFHPEIQ